MNLSLNDMSLASPYTEAGEPITHPHTLFV